MQLGQLKNVVKCFYSELVQNNSTQVYKLAILAIYIYIPDHRLDVQPACMAENSLDLNCS